MASRAERRSDKQAALLGGFTATNAVSVPWLLSLLWRHSYNIVLALSVISLSLGSLVYLSPRAASPPQHLNRSRYGRFPRKADPFAFLPCTNETNPPALDAADPLTTWTSLFDPDQSNWTWGKRSDTTSSQTGDQRYEGRGLFLCGYLDVPLDYTNSSDPRIARLAVTKFQADGKSKSERTIVVNPGGPGGSGTEAVWKKGEFYSNAYSDGQFDVLGWDPRGVNASLPAASCFPYKADRDRWTLLARQHLGATFDYPMAQLQAADALNEALLRGCFERLGDLPRFVSTAFVARDLEEIREALGEEELTAVMFSYGTGIGQTYANMFPDKVGRMVLDGTEYVRDHRLIGGFGWTALDNTTDAWHDGLLGECVRAGPTHCTLANPISTVAPSVTYAMELAQLQARMTALFQSILLRPVPGYTTRGGPAVLTYSTLMDGLYQALYRPATWPATADMLAQLEKGNATMALLMMEEMAWAYDPASAFKDEKAGGPVGVQPSRGRQLPPAGTEDLGTLVICADAFHGSLALTQLGRATSPMSVPSLDWYLSLWQNMTAQSFIAGNSRFYDILPCRHFATHWPRGPAETYMGDLNNTLSNPVLLIAEPYDPATPLRNGRRLAREMGASARLVVHHGYGHCSGDTSNCTTQLARDYIFHGMVPTNPETDCYADSKPFADARTTAAQGTDYVSVWREHVLEMGWRRG